MDVKKPGLQTNIPAAPSTQGTQPQTGIAAKTAAGETNAATNLNPSDMVTLSMNSLKQSQLATLMTGFQDSLVDTLSAYKPGSGMDSLYNLAGTPVDRYMNQNLGSLTPEMKQSFMDMYGNLSRTSGGLVPQNLISQTFGQTGGFGQFLTSLTNRLNRLPVAATPPAGFPDTGGVSGKTAKSG